MCPYEVYQLYISKLYQHIGKVNHYQVYHSSLQVYINSVLSVSVGTSSISSVYLINEYINIKHIKFVECTSEA